MPLMVLGLVIAGALLILAVVLVTPHRQRTRRVAADGNCAGDTSWMPGSFSDGGSSDCGAGDAGGGGCDGGGGGGGD